jgi:hypothetical protein
MQARRFDALTRALAGRTNRRVVFKGLLGLGGLGAVGSVLRDDAGAARRGFSGPSAPPAPMPPARTPTAIPAVPTPLTVCPHGSFPCGGECCSTSQSQCCDNECCVGACYGEELCCLLPRQYCAITGECCAAGSSCCANSGCCGTGSHCCTDPTGAEICVPNAIECCTQADCPPLPNGQCANGFCVCTPYTCESYAGQCGSSLPDGCGKMIDCSRACPPGWTCQAPFCVSNNG